jgi:transcription-repair coupling factor (superfamily II helicase)
MSLISSNEAISDLRQELVDRFGKIPPQLETLIRLLQLKILAMERGVRSAKEQKGELRIEYTDGKVRTILLSGPDKLKTAWRGIAG